MPTRSFSFSLITTCVYSIAEQSTTCQCCKWGAGLIWRKSDPEMTLVSILKVQIWEDNGKDRLWEEGPGMCENTDWKPKPWCCNSGTNEKWYKCHFMNLWTPGGLSDVHSLGELVEHFSVIYMDPCSKTRADQRCQPVERSRNSVSAGSLCDW